MKMASLFKDFITTYNRTYETEEGEDPARGPNQIRPSPLWPLGVGRGRTGEGVHPFRNSEVPKFLPSCPGLGGYLRDLTHYHLIFLVRNHGPPSFWGEWDGTKDRFSPLEAPGMMAFPVTSCLGALWGPFGFCHHPSLAPKVYQPSSLITCRSAPHPSLLQALSFLSLQSLLLPREPSAS